MNNFEPEAFVIWLLVPVVFAAHIQLVGVQSIGDNSLQKVAEAIIISR